MDLRKKISSSLKQAMKDKDARRLSTLRLINAAIKDQEIALRSSDGDGQIGDSEILAILGKMREMNTFLSTSDTRRNK